MPIPKTPLLPLSEYQKRWAYCPQTGLITAITSYKGVKPGDVIGAGQKRRYPTARLGGGNWTLHRVAWLFITGEDPGIENEVDHVNGDTHDNSATNLRIATRSQNMRNRKRHENNRLGARGVYRKSNGRYAAAISCDGRRYHLGNYDTVEEASIAYRAAAVVAHGEFQRVE